jgi:hypothetical protein
VEKKLEKTLFWAILRFDSMEKYNTRLSKLYFTNVHERSLFIIVHERSQSFVIVRNRSRSFLIDYFCLENFSKQEFLYFVIFLKINYYISFGLILIKELGKLDTVPERNPLIW